MTKLKPDSATLEHLLEIGRKVLAEQDIDRLLSTAMDGAIEISGAERGIIILFDAEGKSRFHTARNLEKEDLQQPKYEISRTIIKKVRTDKQPVFLRNALEDPEFNETESVLSLKILSVICLPLVHHDQIFGAVYLDNRTVRGAFKPRNFEFAQKFTEFISAAAFYALERRNLSDNVEALQRDLREKYQFGAIIGTHPAMTEILNLVAQVADTEATILIQGESGTGKELIARALHENSSRAGRPFVAINCGALQENLLESELFGHVKGAFTGASENKIGWFERGHGGTIFLDEVGEMSQALQLKLLRVLQAGEFSPVGSTIVRETNARIIAATNRKLKQLVADGKFREDVFYRLNVIVIDLPPLRERMSDIPLLADHFCRAFGQKYGKPNLRMSPKVRAELLKYEFPGNIRELENMIQRAAILTNSESVEPKHLPASLTGAESMPAEAVKSPTFKAAKQHIIEKFEKDFIIDQLAGSAGNISRAARASGMDVKNFFEKMKRYKIDPKSFTRK